MNIKQHKNIYANWFINYQLFPISFGYTGLVHFVSSNKTIKHKCVAKRNYYASSLGRFTGKDSVGYPGYNYAKNNPMRYVDRFGCKEEKEIANPTQRGAKCWGEALVFCTSFAFFIQRILTSNIPEDLPPESRKRIMTRICMITLWNWYTCVPAYCSYCCEKHFKDDRKKVEECCQNCGFIYFGWFSTF